MESYNNDKFDAVLGRFILMLHQRIRTALSAARDKDFVALDIKRKIEMEAYSLCNPVHMERIWLFFGRYYKRGERIDYIMSEIKARHYPDDEEVERERNPPEYEKPTVILDEEDVAKDAEFADQIPVYEQLVNEVIELPCWGDHSIDRIKEYLSDDRKLFKMMIRFAAVMELPGNIRDILDIGLSKPASNNGNDFPVKWTATNGNKNEFVQLVYALHHAGLINDGKGEITKTVEALAKTLHVQLGDNWQSNHSASVHKSKVGYEPPIFEKLRKSYSDYAMALIEGKRISKRPGSH